MTNPKPEDGALIVPDQVRALQRAGAPEELIKAAWIRPDLAERAYAIITSRPIDQYNPMLHPARALAAAMYEEQTGQVCGRHFYADNRMGIVPGYQGLQREAAERNVGEYVDDYRAMTQAEHDANDIKPGDEAVICELTIIERARKLRLAGLPMKPVIGIGIVRHGEKFKADGKTPIPMSGGYTWHRKARNRALKDALRHAGYASTAKEVLADAERAEIAIDFPEDKQAHLTREQAVYLQEQATAQDEARVKRESKLAQERAAELLKQAGVEMSAPETPPFDSAVTELAGVPIEVYHPSSIEPIRQKLLAWAAEVNDGESAATPRQIEWTALALGVLTDDTSAQAALMLWAFGDYDDLTKGMAKAVYEWTRPERSATGSMKLTGPALTEFPQVIAALLEAHETPDPDTQE